MRNIKQLTPLEMQAAEDYFQTLVDKRRKLRHSTYHNYDETRSPKRTMEKSIKLTAFLSRAEKAKILSKEKISIYDVCRVYQKSLRIAYQKMYKGIHDTPYVANYIYTKGWIDFENVKRGKKIETRIHFNREHLKDFTRFYRRVIR